MSDQAANSFGDPNAWPPTPKRTPAAALSSPLLQTPKQTASSHFDESSGWTPRFAEEYSVFNNSTPGNLQVDPSSSRSGAFNTNLDFAPLSPAAPSSAKKRPLSAEGVASRIAAHANHFTADPSNLAPVDPARRLPSSPPVPLNLSHQDKIAGPNVTPKNSQAPSRLQQHQQGPRSAKKPRRASIPESALRSPVSAHKPAQTATPPPSSRGGRKLAPKPQMDNMQNQGFPQPDFSSASQPPLQLNTAFMAPTGNPDDVFGYPMEPATAPPITGPRPFWGMDMDTSGMGSSGMAIDVDLSSAGTDIFQANPSQPIPNGQMSSLDWGRANFHGLQDQQQQQEEEHQHQQRQQVGLQQPSRSQGTQQNATPRRERPLAPKTATTPNMAQQSPGQNFFGFSHMPENPFSASPGGVDPGLLFSQPRSSAPLDSSQMSMSMPMSMDGDSQPPASSAPATMARTQMGVDSETRNVGAPMPAGNSAPLSGSQGSAKSHPRKQMNLAPALSPTKKSSDRPNLSRSFSESARGGKRTPGANRNILPALAPARPATVHQPSLLPPPPPLTSSQGSNRPQSQGGRPAGRTSPLKTSHHHRLSSLTSIPENTANISARSGSAKRASVKFVIDENGRARAETVVDEDDEAEPEPEPELEMFVPKQRSAQRNSWGGPSSLPVAIPDSDDEYSSSSDDEPIIIPSRNTSFNLPEPPKSSGSGASRPPTASSNNIFAQNRPRYRSFSDRPSASSFRRDQDADDMDVDPPPPASSQPPRPSTGGSLGDAAAELRKVMQAAHNPRRPATGQQLPGSGAGSSGHRQRFTPGQRSSSLTISETSLPGASPAQQSKVRCVCNRPEAGEGAFLVKCDSCDCLLHGQCVDMPRPDDVPHVYICAFCANTPNMRGGRMRYTGRTNTGAQGGLMGPPVSNAANAAANAAAAAAAASSPLAHKSFRSFR